MSFFFCSVLFSYCLQAQQHPKGLRWEDRNYEQVALKINYDQTGEQLPAMYSVKKFCPPVINQGTSNTAVALSAVWYGRTLLESLSCSTESKPFQESYNGFLNHRLLVEDCSQAVSLLEMLESLQQQGARKFKEFKDFCPDSISSADLEGAVRNRIAGYHRLFQVFDSKEVKVNAIRSSVYNGNAVVLGLIHTPSLDKALDVWQVGDQRSRGEAGHSVCVVGYDDTKYGGAFEVVSSWGKSWGSGGFTWIRYEDVKDMVIYGLEFFDSQFTDCSGKEIGASVQFVKSNGEPMQSAVISSGAYTLASTHPNGTEFVVKINTTSKMYAYALFADPSFSVFSVFPQEGVLVSNALTQQKQQVKLPVGNLPFVLEPPIGTNHFIFIFSAVELPVQDVIDQVKNTNGNLTQRIEVLMKNKSVPKAISWKDGIEFMASYEKDFFVAMTVRLDQIE